MKYRIIADSSSNIFQIEKNEQSENMDYVSVPLKIITDEKEYTDDDKLHTGKMVNELSTYKGKSTTSCPNINDWLNAFGDSEQIFALSITSALSGAYSAALQAKDVYLERHPQAKVCIIDTLSTGPEMELLIEKIIEFIGKGIEFEEIEKRIQKYQSRTHLLFSLESLKNFVNNGRVHPAIAAAAGVLGIRIVGKASEEGTLQPLHKCRKEKQIFRKMAEEMKNEGFQNGKIRIAHCMNEAMANKLSSFLKEEFGDCDIKIRTCGGLCSYYAEKGGVLLGFEGSDI
ncbi:MAG: DegV family protein [Eubacterium sp.]|nr:DegV family protein [Eubacterium sp.]MDD7208582.1 DegV family protein [Lachnospiraceae bacterium]MDY5497528.1 DegV family protein [Anaerobutyricum sp.]